MKRFCNTYRFCDRDNNKFCLMLRKDVYPCKYMDSWKRFNETTLPEREEFYSNLNMEDITDADYKHGKKVKKKFEIKTLGELHDLYVQSNTVLLADVFENFRNKFIKNTNLNHLIFISTWISMTSMIEKTDVKLELLTNIDVLLMVQKRIRGGVFNSIHQYAATKNKYMKKYNTDNESSYIMCLDPNNIYGWAMPQKLPVDSFEW